MARVGFTSQRFFNGDIAELLIYNRALSAEEREAVNFYLNSKYSFNLPIVATGKFRDSNFDGLTDYEDYILGINPYNMDSDGDGLSNYTEIMMGTNPFMADTDCDGVPDNLDAYPLDPTRTTPTAMPATIAISSGNNQIAAVGQFNPAPFTVLVKNADGSAPLANANVTFGLVSGGGALAAASGGALAPDGKLTVPTGTDGTAQVWYKQTLIPGVVSSVHATVGIAQVTFLTTSALIIAPAPVDTDGNGLPDAWEIQYFGHKGVDPNADSDGDGLTNLQEYQLGRNPTKGAVADTNSAVRIQLFLPRN
jgi:hypothetical protein